MVNSKRILSVILSIVMVLTIVPFGTFGTAVAVSENDVTTQAADSNDGKLIVPKATLKSTEIIRTANSANHMQNGTALVKATESGVGELLSSDTGYTRRTAYYAGETPKAPTVVLTTDMPVSSPTVTCLNNANVKFKSATPDYAEGTDEISGERVYTYTWTLSTSDSSTNYITVDQKSLHFQVGYSYSYTTDFTYNSIKNGSMTTPITTTKTYKAYCSSSVENIIQPGGFYVFRVRKGNTWHENDHMAFIVRLMGMNTFGSYYEKNDTSGWDKGYPNFQDQGGLEKDNGFVNLSNTTNGISGYGMVHCSKINTSSDGTTTFGEPLDYDRPVSTIYVDRGTAEKLSAYNARLSVYPNMTRGDYDGHFIRWIRVLEGESTFNQEVADNANSKTELGMQNVNNDTKITVCTNYNVALSGDGYSSQSDSVRTTLSNGNIQSRYTFVVNVGTHHSKGDRVSNAILAISYRIVSYDKSELRGLINETLADNDPSTPIASESEIGINPNSEYYTSEDAYNTYLTALQAAQDVIADSDTDQTTIDNAYTALEEAIEGLEVKKADFTSINTAIEAAKKLVSDNYTDETWSNLQAKINAANQLKAVDNEYSYFYQTKVEMAAIEINQAIDDLEYGPADYDEIYALVDQYEQLYEEDYSPETWAVLKKAIEDVDYTLTVDNQGLVDTYAENIANAFDGLAWALADYSAVNVQVERYNAVKDDANLYQDLKWKQVETAYKAIQWDKTWKQQTTVNNYAKNLKNALDGLKYKPADYTAVDAAYNQADALNPNWYTPASWSVLETAIFNIVDGLDITHQAEVDKMASDLTKAINGLVEAEGNYDAVTAAKNRFAALNEDNYTSQSWQNVQNIINAVDYTLTASKQSIIDNYASSINTAIDGLVELPADYTSVNSLISQWNNLPNKSNYTDVSVLAVTTAISAVKDNITITHQDVVNGYATAISQALAGLKLKPASYTEVDKAIEAAKPYQANQTTFAENYNGYSYYTSKTYKSLTDALAAVVRDYDITKQAQVDTMAANINLAISGLKCNAADYTAVYDAIGQIPEDLESGNYSDESAAAVIVAQEAVVTGYKTDRQGDVDNMAARILTAISNLKLKSADYSAINTLKSQWEARTDKDDYTAASVKAVDDAFLAVNWDYNYTQQALVNAMKDAIVAKINALELDVADYTSVTNAIATANAALENESLYTSESVAALRQVISSVDYTLKSDKQDVVNGYATAILQAVTDLKYKPANYQAVTNAKNTIPADLTVYTTETVATLNSVLESIDYTLTIDKQSVVDDYATRITNAVTALKFKPADYSALDSLVDAVSKLDKNNYTNYNTVYWTDIYPYVEEYIPQHRTYNITQQNEVTAMIATLQGYVDSLILKGADYTAVNNKLAEVETAIETGIYTDSSVLAYRALVDTIKKDYDILHQTDVDNYVSFIEESKAVLIEKPSDFSKVDALFTQFDGLTASDYKNYEEVKTTYIDPYRTTVANAKTTLTKISQQNDVDAMETTLKGYIDLLEKDINVVFEAKEGSTTHIGEEGSLKYIYGLKTGITEKELVENYLEYENVRVEVVPSENSGIYLGTGTTVNVYSTDGASEKLVDSYKIVIFGDLDGNGAVDVYDSSIMCLIASGKAAQPKDEIFIASNILKDGVIDNYDFNNLIRAASGSAVIDQETGLLK